MNWQERIDKYEKMYGKFIPGAVIATFDDGKRLYVLVLGGIGDAVVYFDQNDKSAEYIATYGLKVYSDDIPKIFRNVFKVLEYRR